MPGKNFGGAIAKSASSVAVPLDVVLPARAVAAVPL